MERDDAGEFLLFHGNANKKAKESDKIEEIPEPPGEKKIKYEIPVNQESEIPILKDDKIIPTIKQTPELFKKIKEEEKHSSDEDEEEEEEKSSSDEDEEIIEDIDDDFFLNNININILYSMELKDENGIDIYIKQKVNVFLLKKILKKSRLPEDYSFLGYEIDKKMEKDKKYNINSFNYISVKAISNNESK